jgi:arylsulfatase A-like enzyme
VTRGRKSAGSDPDSAQRKSSVKSDLTAADRPLPAPRILLLAVTVGLAAGLAEIQWVSVVIGTGIRVRLSAHYVWMIPAADVLFALAATVLLLAVARWRPRARTPRAVTRVLVSLAAVQLLLHIGSLHPAAAGVLALGLGFQAARMAGGRIARLLYRTAPAAALVLALIVAFFTVRMTLALRAEKRAALAALPVPRNDVRNVLLLILDTERANGLARDVVPHLARYADRGVYFDRAVAPSPWTLPSHATMFTGVWPHKLSAGWGTPLDAEHATLAEVLAGRGYVTAGFVANLMFATRGTGLGRGFITYDDYPVNLGQVLISSSLGRGLAAFTTLRKLLGYHELLNRRSAAEITDAFLDWQQRNHGRPFFAFVNFFEAHEPYFPVGYGGSALWPGRRWTKFKHAASLSNGESAYIRDKWNLSPEETVTHASAYRDAIRQADVALGRLLDELDGRGVLRNTIVIIAGDHGEQLGEHGLFEHNNSLYLPTLHVPLLILPAEGLAQPVRVAQVVSLRGIPATVVDLLGDEQIEFPGRSLAAFWRASAGGGVASVAADTAFAHLAQGNVRQPWYPINRGSQMFSLTTSRWHYIRNGDGSEELYDWENDPSESVDLGAQPDAEPVLRSLRRKLDALLQEQ